MSYGWLLVIIVIAGAALYAMGILNPATYMKKGCVGFEKIHYKDHAFRAGSAGVFVNPSGDLERESQFQLRLQNGAGTLLRISDMDAEYPEGVHVLWTRRGFDCDYYRVAGDMASGCSEANVSEGEVVTLAMEDVGDGTLDLRHGAVYRMKVKVTFDAFNALEDHTETAICSGKIEDGLPGSSTGPGTGGGGTPATACLLLYTTQEGSSVGLGAFSWEGGAWSATDAFTSDVADHSHASVSCPPTGACMATWTVAPSGSNTEIMYATFNGASWSSATALTSDSDMDNYPAVSCPSSSYCMAVWSSDMHDWFMAFESGPQSSTDIWYATWNGASWSSPAALSANSHPDTWAEVSCTSSSFCMATWFYQDTTGDVRSLYATWDGASWSAEQVLAESGGEWYSTPSVSCASSSMCMALMATYYVGGHDMEIYYSTWDGASWTTAAALTSDDDHDDSPAVSCPTTGRCVAAWLSNPGNPRSQLHTAVWESGSGWGSSTAVEPEGDYHGHPGVSCQSASACTAAWQSYDGRDAEVYYSTWDGASWSAVAAVTANDVQDYRTTLSCPSV